MPLVMHCALGDVHVRPLDVACVPGIQLNSFSLYAVMPVLKATLNDEEAHLLDGDLPVLRRDAGSYV